MKPIRIASSPSCDIHRQRAHRCIMHRVAKTYATRHLMTASKNIQIRAPRIYRRSSRPSSPGATPRWPPLVPAHMCACFLAGHPCPAETGELGSSPGSFWFLATAPPRPQHGSRRRAAKNAAEPRSGHGGRTRNHGPGRAASARACPPTGPACPGGDLFNPRRRSGRRGIRSGICSLLSLPTRGCTYASRPTVPRAVGHAA